MDFIKEGLSHVIDKKWLTIAEPEFKGSNVKKFTENENGLLLVSEIFSKKERACLVVILSTDRDIPYVVVLHRAIE